MVFDFWKSKSGKPGFNGQVPRLPYTKRKLLTSSFTSNNQFKWINKFWPRFKTEKVYAAYTVMNSWLITMIYLIFSHNHQDKINCCWLKKNWVYWSTGWCSRAVLLKIFKELWSATRWSDQLQNLILTISDLGLSNEIWLINVTSSMTSLKNGQ